MHGMQPRICDGEWQTMSVGHNIDRILRLQFPQYLFDFFSDNCVQCPSYCLIFRHATFRKHGACTWIQILDRSIRASTTLLSGHDAAISLHAMMSSLNVAVEKDTAKCYIGVCQLSLAQANEIVQRTKAKEGGQLFPLFSHLAA